jgi:Coenzyme PQQ synthesis protein D (PqqD)
VGRAGLCRNPRSFLFAAVKRRRVVDIDPERLLDAVPTVNRAVRVEQNASGTVLFVPVKRTWWMRLFALILPVRAEKGYALDALGLEVFEACDGTRNLERIIEEFAARHQVRFHEARLSVAQFMKSLTERGLVALAVFDAKVEP